MANKAQGKGLIEKEKEQLEKAKNELRKLYGREEKQDAEQSASCF